MYALCCAATAELVTMWFAKTLNSSLCRLDSRLLQWFSIMTFEYSRRSSSKQLCNNYYYMHSTKPHCSVQTIITYNVYALFLRLMFIENIKNNKKLSRSFYEKKKNTLTFGGDVLNVSLATIA